MGVTEQLKPRGEIDPDNRTEGKDDAFQSLEELRRKGEFHGRPVEDLAEEIGWSEQHVRNVLKEYYGESEDKRPAEEEEKEVRGDVAESYAGPGGKPEPDPEPQTDLAQAMEFVEVVEIKIPSDVDKESFLRGYVAGYLKRDQRL